MTDVVSTAIDASRVDLRAQLDRTSRRPSEMVITSRDRVCQPSMQYDLAVRLGSRVTEVDAGHDLPLRDLDRLSAVLVDVLKRLDDQIAATRGEAD